MATKRHNAGGKWQWASKLHPTIMLWWCHNCRLTTMLKIPFHSFKLVADTTLHLTSLTFYPEIELTKQKNPQQ